MKRWILWSALAANMTVLTACAQSGGANPAPETSSPDLGQQCQSGLSAPGESQDASLLAADPFETQGKVVLTDRTGSQYMNTASLGDASLKAGTELTVVLREQCSDGTITQAIRGANPVESDQPTPSGVRTYRWVVNQDASVQDLSAAAEADPCVAGISNAQESQPIALPEENGEGASDAISPEALSNDPRVGEQGHLKMLEAEAAYPQIFANNAANRPVVIAVIDTGIDMKHEDLKDVLWQNSKEIPGNGIDDDHNGYVDDVNGYNFATKKPSPQYITSTGLYHHGTHVAGLAAAQANNGKGGSGVMGTGAKIMALNVFGPGSGASTADIANAVRYAADNGADVINLSLGGSGRNASYEAALAYAVKKGVTIVAAAGNEKTEVSEQYFMSPAAYGKTYPGLISIGSIDSSNLALSRYSNFSPTYVELAAPGSEESHSNKGLLSTMPNNSYTRIQGTSMASPVAAGSAALAISMIRARGYNPTPAMIEGAMENSGKSVAELTTKIRDGKVLNLKAMADYIAKTYPIGGQAAPQPPSANRCNTGSNL